VAPPQVLYDRPVNIFVGGFIGSPAMNMVEATLKRENGRFIAAARSQQLVLDESLLGARPSLREYEGRPVILGIRPEHLDDASLSSDVSPDRRLRGEVVLREALGSELVVHFTIDAQPALTEDVRELARDVGQESTVQVAASELSKSMFVGRFGPRSRVRTGDVVDVAVDMSTVHAFDLESGLGIYDQS
jgi:multiple sugar transport system ATP-binding protein